MHCRDGFDSAIRTNPRGDDMQFPIISTGTRFVNTSDSSRIWMDRPINKLVVNEHCVDMHCDGLKKALLIDTDGTTIGDDKPGTIIPDAAYQWEGDSSAGLGWYRIPKTAYTEVNGDKIEFADKMPNTGIVRSAANLPDSECTWVDAWTAYKCHGINHRLLIMESMDVDTLDRRLSPVAMLAEPRNGTHGHGYIDLVNGPQDWSCCFGYACQKRVSNFYFIVGTNLMYEVHLTSTPPIHMRYRVRNNDGGDAILLKIFFPKPQRIDIFVDEQYVAPNNIDLASPDDFQMLPPDDSYIPSLVSQVEGENYFDPTTGFLYILLRGTAAVDYKIQPAVVTKVGASIDMANFFEEDVVSNIAALLGIDPKNIKLTNIIRESSRRKREDSTVEEVELEFTIEPPPVTNLNETSDLDYNSLLGVSANVTTLFQTGALTIPGVNITDVQIQEPIHVPQAEDVDPCVYQDEDPDAACYLAPENNAQDGTPVHEISYAADAAALQESLTFDTLAVPAGLVISTEPNGAFEMAAFTQQPSLYVVDTNGTQMSVVGGEGDPWIVTASVLSGPGGDAVNNVTAEIVDGWATFTDLAIDLTGDDYILQFAIIYPTTVDIPAVNSSLFNVGGRQLSVKATTFPTLQPKATPFTVLVSIWDDALDQVAVPTVASGVSGASCTLEDITSNSGLWSSGSHTAGVFTFADIAIPDTCEACTMKVTCDDGGDFFSVDMFVMDIHDWPVSGHMLKTSTGFKYTGAADGVADLLASYADFMTAQVAAAVAPSRRKRDVREINNWHIVSRKDEL